MHFIQGLTFDDVLLIPNYNGIRSRQDVTTAVDMANKKLEIPVISSNMDTITGLAMANCMASLGGLGILHRFMTIEQNIEEFRQVENKSMVGVSIGVGEAALERAEALIAVGAEIICVDVAHGHAKLVNQTIKNLRRKYKGNIVIIAGNVATYAGADYLAAAGADVIKVGIGGGSVCTTRIKTGFGVPQLSAIMMCRQVDRSLIADGGIRTPGDAVKALAAGADFVMLGGMLAGTEETPGEVKTLMNSGKETRVKIFRGMASREAQEDFMGSMGEWKTAEGIAIEVPIRGSAVDVIRDLMGGIRSGMTYCGAATIKDLQRKAQFMTITPAGARESSPHAMERLAVSGDGKKD
ncbi:MAG: guanosine monophosphate reductase [Acidobacteria bacterium]|nr:guanosine monophosphate reductase [Acidobacteriota bacterium]